SERPDALLGLLADYCRRLAAARNRIESLVLHHAEERLARALLLLAAQHSDTDDAVNLRPAVTHEELAHLIGVSRPLVTKLLGGLRDRGFIESPGAGTIIVHRQKMAAVFDKASTLDQVTS
ncbi:MAG: helix-turn-helix domain-containing protein, partial [Acidobacteria bacterium]|nr:helix-turn-helix domain-containing protein [Acidobacteriota bacterium]